MYCDEAIIRPYARALVLAAQKQGQLARVRGDIEALNAQWEGSEELRTWCNTARSLPKATHAEIVRSLWGDSMTHATCVLLEALSVAGLLSALPNVIRVFRRFADTVEQRVDIEFVFATKPSAALLQSLQKRAIEAYGEKTQFDVRIDETLGAGLIIRAGNTQIDASLKGRLARLKQTFAK